MEYRYGLRSRPPSLGAVPRGLNFKWNSEFIDARMRVRYGVITCDRQLTKEEIYNFELVDMNPQNAEGI